MSEISWYSWVLSSKTSILFAWEPSINHQVHPLIPSAPGWLIHRPLIPIANDRSGPERPKCWAVQPLGRLPLTKQDSNNMKLLSNFISKTVFSKFYGLLLNFLDLSECCENQRHQIITVSSLWSQLNEVIAWCLRIPTLTVLLPASVKGFPLTFGKSVNVWWSTRSKVTYCNPIYIYNYIQHFPISRKLCKRQDWKSACSVQKLIQLCTVHPMYLLKHIPSCSACKVFPQVFCIHGPMFAEIYIFLRAHLQLSENGKLSQNL